MYDFLYILYILGELCFKVQIRAKLSRRVTGKIK